jgi:hypothetical protein
MKSGATAIAACAPIAPLLTLCGKEARARRSAPGERQGKGCKDAAFAGISACVEGANWIAAAPVVGPRCVMLLEAAQLPANQNTGGDPIARRYAPCTGQQVFEKSLVGRGLLFAIERERGDQLSDQLCRWSELGGRYAAAIGMADEERARGSREARRFSGSRARSRWDPARAHCRGLI